jgi:hypothetical protein
LTKAYKYNIFNFTISSEIELSGFLNSKNVPDIFIKFGDSPQTLGESAIKGVLYEALPRKFLLKAFDIARFYVTDGKIIYVHKLDNFQMASARTFLTSSVFGALLLQREIMPIHASIVEHKGSAVIIAGASGAGKSTLAAYMAQQGYPVLGDDIAAIQIQNDHPYVLPGIPHLKLWKDSLNKLNLPNESFSKIRDGIDKYIDYSLLPIDKILPIKHIFLINPQSNQNLSINQIKGKDKFIVLKNNIYRKQFVSAFGLDKTVFQTIATIASHVKIYRLVRPMDSFSVKEMAIQIQNVLNDKENAK